MHHNWQWTLGWAIGIAVTLSQASFGRPIPDETLGNERSRVIDRSGRDFDIDGGARRGSNLFHSFADFDIDQGGSVYFLNPSGIDNIFSRVTGNSSSNILGKLGVRGSANLFLMNPNGILFGAGASLDVQGSFLATTASALQFGEQGVFSATSPESPALLTVNPSAFLFNQVPVGSIANNSIAPAGNNDFGVPQFGLRVPDREGLLLVGGDITMDGGRLNALGGRIELAGLSGTGRINLNPSGNTFRLSVPVNSPLSNISLTNNAFVNTAGSIGGEITVNSNLFNLVNGAQLNTATAGIGDGGNITINANRINFLGVGAAGPNGSQSSGLASSTFASGNAGDVIINADQIKLENGSQILATSSGSGQAGDITITADTIDLIGISADGRNRSAFASETNNAGNAGNITISARRLDIQNGAAISSSTFGTGRAGDLTINVRDAISLVGAGVASGRSIGSNLVTVSQGDGNAGTLTVNTRQLTLQSGGAISASTAGSGQGGTINITADTIEISSVLVNGQLQQSAIGNIATGMGNGGDINITTRTLGIRDGGQITTTASGQGQGGNLAITARESVEMQGGLSLSNGGFVSSILITGTSGSRDAGDLTLNTEQLTLQDRARISASTSGTGRGGDIIITADSIDILGIPQSIVPTDISSETFSFANGGRSGDIVINAEQLNLTNRALVSTSAFGSGQGGSLTVNVDVVNLADGGSLASSTSIAGDAGELIVNADRLSISRGAGINAATGGEGRGGDIKIQADVIELTGVSLDRQQLSAIAATTVGNGSTGRAGNITISTEQLNLRDGAAISTDTANQGRGGDLRITAQDTVTIDGSAVLATGQISPSGISAGTRGAGRAGDIRLNTRQLQIRNNGFISASTFSSGRAGNIDIDADFIELIGQTENLQLSTGISTAVNSNATGNAGRIRIEARELRMQDRAVVATGTQGRGSGSNISIQLDEDLQLLNQSFITSSVFAGSTGDSGDINISARSLTARGGSQIAAVVSRPGRDQQRNRLPGGRGEGGAVQIRTSDFINLSGTSRRGFSSGILTLSERDANGLAGNISIRTGDFRVINGAIVVASTFNRGDAGDIEIDADNFAAFSGGQVVTNTRNRGQAGSITLSVNNNLSLSGVDPNYQDRRERARQYANQPEQLDRASDVIVGQGAASGLFANTGRKSSGDGGTINLSAGTLRLDSGARISARSQGSGIAGNIDVDVNEITEITDSDITTSAQNSSGGSINITSGRIRLHNDSDIRTEVANDVGNGGDITLTADSVVAFDDSDILAFAGRQGGDITLDTPAVFFEGGRQAVTASTSNAADLDKNNQVNVNADGAVAGVITLPDVSFIENSLSALTETALDSDQLLANSCIARTETGGTFLITGPGALPAAPGNDAASAYPTGEIREIPEAREDEQIWQHGDPIVEPQGVYRLPNGRLVMSREC
jgi:filamentous hemagglutinin family protein